MAIEVMDRIFWREGLWRPYLLVTAYDKMHEGIRRPCLTSHQDITIEDTIEGYLCVRRII